MADVGGAGENDEVDAAPVDADAVRIRLGEIVDELLATPESDLATRFRLESERDALRAKARSVPFDKFAHRSDDDLIDEARSLRSRINALHGKTLNRATMASADGNSASSDGFMGGSLTSLNASVLAAGGAGGANTRLAEVVQELERRGIDLGEKGPSGRAGG